MTRPPLILASPSTQQRGAEFYDYSVSLSQTYLDAIALAGGLAVVCPVETTPRAVKNLVAHCDGVMLTGGDDIEPELYTGHLPAELKATVQGVDGKRDLLELMLILEVFKQQKPLLAICRGHQILNVALGGTLIVDIPKQVKTTVKHNQLKNKDRVVHEVRLEKKSLLARTMRKQVIKVNSSHHQAVEQVADSLEVTGRSADGIVEVMELKRERAYRTATLPYLLSVQFHPERLVRGYPVFLKLFRGFVQACEVDRNARYEAQSAGSG